MLIKDTMPTRLFLNNKPVVMVYDYNSSAWNEGSLLSLLFVLNLELKISEI